MLFLSFLISSFHSLLKIHPFDPLLMSVLLLWTISGLGDRELEVTAKFLHFSVPRLSCHWKPFHLASSVMWKWRGVNTYSPSVGCGCWWINVQSPVLQRNYPETHFTVILQDPQDFNPNCSQYWLTWLYFTGFYPSLPFSLYYLSLIILFRILS